MPKLNWGIWYAGENVIYYIYATDCGKSSGNKESKPLLIIMTYCFFFVVVDGSYFSFTKFDLFFYIYNRWISSTSATLTNED